MKRKRQDWAVKLTIPRSAIRLMLLTLAVAGLAVCIGGFLFAWSGIYNVAASSGHMAVTRWFLQFGMQNSVETNSIGINGPDLADENKIRLGAGHYLSSCAPCHGGPGLRANPVPEAMLPTPPTLVDHVPKWKDRELFWIVKHGIKYAGMPAWTSLQRDDEVWAVVAFLRKLPQLNAEQFEAITKGNAPRSQLTGKQIVQTGSRVSSLTVCSRCHDNSRSEPTSKLVPRLAGQSGAYIVKALQAYASGARASGIMQPVAMELSTEEISRIAAYYAGLDRTSDANRQQTTYSSSLIAEGARLALHGDGEAGIPSCVSCHRAQGASTYPRLAGQSADYIVNQLHLWKKGARGGPPQSELMQQVANRMSDKQIESVAEYFSSLTLESDDAMRASRNADTAEDPNKSKPVE